MAKEAPDPIDFTGTNYDALETALTNYLNLKVILVRDWEIPNALFTAESNRMNANWYGDDAAKAAAAQAFAKTEAATLAALRAKVAERDIFVGSDLSDNDLRSLKKVGHITLRQGNAEPEQAVVIFDPGAAVAKYAANPVLYTLFNEKFDNAWSDFDKTGGGKDDVEVKNLVENLDIDAGDLRVYETVKKVFNALRNQGEFNNLDKGAYYQPHYYNFAQLSKRGYESGLAKSDSSLSAPAVAERYSFEKYLNFEKLGAKDPDLKKKITLASAVRNLAWHASAPMDTFAHLGLAERMTYKEINAIQDDLGTKLRDKLAARRPEFAEETYRYSMDGHGLADWRVLFPIFREVYAEDKSTGAQRQYLDTIMEGLQKWFPTITNAPVPDLSNEGVEPPRALASPKAGKQAKPKPSQPKVA